MKRFFSRAVFLFANKANALLYIRHYQTKVEGKKVVIIGPSGSGKSTVLRCINKLESIQSGKIVFEGVPVTEHTELSALRTKIGMVFQKFNLFPHMTVLENSIEAPMSVKGTNLPVSYAAAGIDMVRL